MPEFSLPRRLAVYIVSIALMSSVLFSSTEIYLEYQATKASLVQNAEQLIESTRPTAEEAIYKLDPTIADNLTGGMILYQHIVQSTIVDERGRVLSSKTRPEKKVWSPLNLAPITFSIDLNVVGSSNTGIYSIVLDLEQGLQLFYNSAMMTIVQQFIEALFLSFTVYLIVLFVVARPVQTLSTSINDSMPGQISTPLPCVQRRDELGSLARRASEYVDSSYQFSAERSKILDTVSDCVISIDKLGIIQLSNTTTGSLFAMEQDKIIGQPLSILIPSFDHEFLPALEQYVNNRDAPLPKAKESFGTSAAGPKFPIEISLGAYELSNHVRFIATIRDLTRERNAQEQNKALEEQLRQSQKMEAVGQLAGGVAHDFNNILTIIQGNIALAKELINQDKIDELSELLDIIDTSSLRAASLTKQLLLFSRKDVLKPQYLDINDVIEEAIELFDRLIPGSIKISFKPRCNAFVYSDRSQIQQILMNLALNARDAMPDGGQLTIELNDVNLADTLCISHPGVSPGDFVSIQISDTGIGMSKEVKGKVFEPFYTTKPPGQGTGLGLATVYAIVQKWHGFINMESELDKGTTFTIYLPMAEQDSFVSSSGAKSDISLSNKVILVCEDDDAVRYLIVKALKGAGCYALESNHPDYALVLAEKYQNEIQLLITDIILPGMSGKDLSDVLGKHYGTTTLFVSGYTADRIAEQGVLAQNIHFLAKPFSNDALLQAIKEALA